MKLGLLVRFNFDFSISNRKFWKRFDCPQAAALLGSVLTVAVGQSFVDVSSDTDPSVTVRLYDPMVDMKAEQFILKYFKYKWIAKCYKKGECRNGMQIIFK